MQQFVSCLQIMGDIIALPKHALVLPKFLPRTRGKHREVNIASEGPKVKLRHNSTKVYWEGPMSLLVLSAEHGSDVWVTYYSVGARSPLHPPKD